MLKNVLIVVDEKQVYKAETIKEFQEKITAIFSRDVRLMKKEERKIACNKSLGKVGERLLRLYSEKIGRASCRERVSSTV